MSHAHGHGEDEEGGDVLVLFTSQRYRSTPAKLHESRRKIPTQKQADQFRHERPLLKTSRMIDM